MPQVRLARLTLEREEFSKLSNKDKRRMLMITALLRDINVLYKCLAFSRNRDDRGPQLAASSSLIIFFVLTLIGKLHEVHEFFEQDGIYTDAVTRKGDFPRQVKTIRRFFGDIKTRKLFNFVRNNLSFHYGNKANLDPKVEKSLDDFGSFTAWLSEEDSGNEIFDFASAGILKVICDEMSSLGFQGDKEQFMPMLFDLPDEVSKLLQKFSREFLVRGFPVTWIQHGTDAVTAPGITDVELPFIVAADR